MAAVIDLDDDRESSSFLDELNAWEAQISPRKARTRSKQALQPAIDYNAAGPARKRVKVIDLTADSSFEVLSTPPRSTRKKAKQGSELDLEEDVTCPICLDYFLGPQTLSCGHCLCSECLATCFAKDPNVCPTCRIKSTQAPYRALVLESIVEKVAEQAFKQMAADGKTREANEARSERNSKLKALEISRIADAAPHQPRFGAMRRRR